MNDQNFNPEQQEEHKTEIYVNDYGATRDSAVVVEEADRTVLLTSDETVVIPKESVVDLPPKNRARKIYAGMWGTTELVTVGLSLLAILTTVLLFVFLVLPAQRELDYNRAKVNELSKIWEDSNKKYGSDTSTEDSVRKLITSVDDFESRLPNETTGKNALYQRVNGLIAAYGLTNTAGPDYAPLEIADQNRNQQSEDGKGRSKFISIFPGMYMTMTLDGTYQNLRGFINEIERSEQFVVVSAVELEPSENKEKQDNNQPQQTQTQPQPNQVGQPINYQRPLQGGSNPTGVQPYTGGGQFQPQTQSDDKIDRGKMRGETVTLRLEMAAYFRRTNFVPQVVETSVTR